MIDIDVYPIFVKNKTTLKETSKSAPDVGAISFLTESQIEVVNFDNVKKEYADAHAMVEEPSSNDALYSDSKGKFTFIEFKDGFVKEYDVRRKCFDSVLIFTGIVGVGIDYTQENMDYILVYNGEKNSKSKDKIGKYFLGKAGNELIKFRLDYFKGYCFKAVHTYTPEEFENMFIIPNMAKN